MIDDVLAQRLSDIRTVSATDLDSGRTLWTKVVDNDVSRLESLDGQALVMQTAPSPRPCRPFPWLQRRQRAGGGIPRPRGRAGDRTRPGVGWLGVARMNGTTPQVTPLRRARGTGPASTL
jgi:hypothetical protein